MPNFSRKVGGVLSALGVALVLAGCASLSVRQLDLDSWAGVPVDALDTHTVFLGIPMVRTLSNSGVEIRNYANSRSQASCFTSGGSTQTTNKYVTASAFTTCSNNKAVCNNIFYIKDAKVIEYAPTGQCYTDESLQPQARYKRLMN